MESDSTTIEAALQGIILMSAIPVVAYALWGDYFIRHIEELRLANPKFEPAPELERIRIGGIFAGLFQLMLFLASSDVRKNYPLATLLTFSVSVWLQFVIQSSLEKKVKTEEAGVKTDNLSGLAVRAAASWLFGAFIQLCLLVFFVGATLTLVTRMHLAMPLTLFLCFTAGIFGIIVGLGFNHTLGPIYLKIIFPTSVLSDPNLLSRFANCFTRANLKIPLIHIIEFDAIRLVGILYSGISRGLGPLRPTLFISRHLLTHLSMDEVETLILNQAGHVALRHFRKRFLYSLTLMMSCTILALFSIVLSDFLFPQSAFSEMVGPAIALISFLTSFKLLGKQKRDQEFETDAYTVEKLGVSARDLVNALRKLDLQMEPDPSLPVGVIHPDTERRVQAIAKHFHLDGGSLDTGADHEKDRNKAA